MLLDCDGVLADFIGGVLHILDESFGMKFSREACDRFDFAAALGLDAADAAQLKCAIGADGFCSSLAPYEGAREGVAALRRIAEVYVVTTPWYSCPTWTHEREWWLEKHFGIPHSRVIHTSAKHLVRGDIFVDDKTEAVAHWCAAHPDDHGIRWNTPHNEREPWDGAATSDWDYLRRLASARASMLRAEAGLRELVANTEDR